MAAGISVTAARPRMVGIAVAGAVILLDQISKWWIVHQVMQLPRQIEVLPVFDIVLVWNSGASFGVLSRNGPWARWLLIVLAVAIGIALVVWIARTANPWVAAALGMVLGGAVGNLLDRMRYGAVVDFLDFHLGTRPLAGLQRRRLGDHRGGGGAAGRRLDRPPSEGLIFRLWCEREQKGDTACDRPLLSRVVVGLALALTGCDAARESFGFTKQAPDEFSVVTRAPLVIPPDFGLRPPQPGAPRPQEKPVVEKARETVLGKEAAGQQFAAADGAQTLSEGERALLSEAHAVSVDPSIRHTVDRESTLLADADHDFIDKLIFWQKAEPPGEVVDPGKESQRIRQAVAMGESPTKGETPTIQRRKKGFLEGLF